MRASEEDFGICAAKRCGDGAQSAAATQAGAKQDQKKLLAFRSQIKRQRHLLTERIERADSFAALRTVGPHAQDIASGDALSIGIGSKKNRAAVAAARQWEFSTALFAEKKEPISGLLTFEFKPKAQ